MARRRKEADASGGTPPAEPVNVKIERTLHRRLKMLATAAGEELTAYVNKVLRDHAQTEWAKFLRDES